jgi:hypothetical protein
MTLNRRICKANLNFQYRRHGCMHAGCDASSARAVMKFSVSACVSTSLLGFHAMPTHKLLPSLKIVFLIRQEAPCHATVRQEPVLIFSPRFMIYVH